jgi:Zn-dependent protease
MNYFILAVAIFPSIVLHEVSHGYVALLFGDTTARDAHRLSLNPLRHVDPFGTVLLPALLVMAGLPPFGYAKPVPVSINRLRNPRKQAIWVSLVGPAVNIVLCVVALFVAKSAIFSYAGQWYVRNDVVFKLAVDFGTINITLAAFNLLPIPPLDGSAIIEQFIPSRRLPNYYQLRAKALPFLFTFIILDTMFLHWGTNFLSDLQGWWFNRLT